ncbi:MAG: glycosyltransferase family 2 protein [Lachnospiraceae bacterium]|nr:glycosyltransferase family 2 protein [Lachnospiraceae bacterium]
MKKQNYKISIIVPVYNSSEYLEQCVDSILLQTYENLELLLIDDESKDQSGEICDRYASEDDRVRVIHQKNAGCTAASLTGLREASGDYYMFIDSDDYVEQDMLTEMSRHLIGQKGEVVCCNHILEKQKQTLPTASSAAPGIYEGAKLKREIKDKLLGNEQRIVPISRCMKLYEKSVFEGNTKYCDTKIRMGEDFNLVFPVLLDCSRMVVMDKAYFYHYRYVETSMAHCYDKDMMDSVNRLENFLRRVIDDKKVENGELLIRKEYCCMLLLVMKNELRNPDRNYMENIQNIFRDAKIRDIVDNTNIIVRGKANRILYCGIKHPNKPIIWILRCIMKLYDNK